MVVELISTGTEILLGNIVNTNTQFLAERCALLGLSMYYQIAVGDNKERMADTIKTALDRSDIVILTGGLRPAESDITKEVCAKVMGTVPDFMMEKDGKTAIILPGSPDELYPLFTEQVMPFLKRLQPDVIRAQTLKICGQGERQVEDKLGDLMDKQTNPRIAMYAETGEVHLRITAKASSEEQAKELMKPVVKEIKQRFGIDIYTAKEEEALEDVVVKLLKKHELTVTTAESCTGGLLAGRLINVAGVSEVYREGFITYSNKSKRKQLGVSKGTLKKYGAVSPQTAKEMATGGVFATDADICVAVTGLAGPDGETEDKPAGLVYIACCMKDTVKVEKYEFKGTRNKVREQSVTKALDLLRRSVLENYK